MGNLVSYSSFFVLPELGPDTLALHGVYSLDVLEWIKHTKNILNLKKLKVSKTLKVHTLTGIYVKFSCRPVFRSYNPAADSLKDSTLPKVKPEDGM